MSRWKWVGIIGFIFVFGSVGALLFILSQRKLISPLVSLEVTQRVRTLDKYSFPRLRAREFVPSPIVLSKVLKTTPTFTSYVFLMQTDGKQVSGVLNMPVGSGPFPTIVMIRGYVDKEIYYPGIGTRRSSENLAQSGYITVAPDFLGYAESSSESGDIFEARFERPVTVLQLLSSLQTIPQVDTTRVGIWAHSNGGQIALSVLEISQKPYPTVLWAPVTQGFPDSVIQYLDELPDKGAYIKKKLGEFNERYQAPLYSIDEYWQDIRAPLSFHQGLADELVSSAGTQQTVATLKSKGVGQIQHFEYPGENHNFVLGSFDLVMARTLSFYQNQLQ